MVKVHHDEGVAIHIDPEFYRRLGWRAEGEKAIALPGELQFRCVSMSKSIAPAARFF